MVLTSRERDTDSGRSRSPPEPSSACSRAGAFGFSLVALDEGANADPYWATLVLRTASSILILSVVLAMRRPVRAPRSYWPALGVIAALDVVGTVFFSVSTTKGLISIVAAVISFVPVFVALLARVFLHERLAADPARRRRRSRSPASSSSPPASDVEADVQHVAVLDDVLLALEPLEPALRRPPRASRTRRSRRQRSPRSG